MEPGPSFGFNDDIESTNSISTFIASIATVIAGIALAVAIKK